MGDCDGETNAEQAARLIREEIAKLASSGRNWKIILNGTAGGRLKTIVTETYMDVSRADHQVGRQT